MSHPVPKSLPRSRRQPQQRRSREIVEAILEAGRTLLAEEGEALTTNRIAERAGVSIGSLYRYFPDKDAIVAAIYEAEREREGADLERDWEPIEDDDLEAFVTALVDFQLERHRRLLELGGDFYRDRHRDYSLAREMASLEVERGITRLLDRHRDRVTVRDAEQAGYLLVRGISGIVRITLDEQPDRLRTAAFRDELVDLMLRYLTAPPR